MDFRTAENEEEENLASVEVSCDYCVFRKADTHALTIGFIFLYPLIYNMELWYLAPEA
jgi:hypothetical protein